MDKAKINAQVHRFREFVALSTGTGQTVYISPGGALKLAKAIRECVKDCEVFPYVKSQFKSKSFEFDGMK